MNGWAEILPRFGDSNVELATKSKPEANIRPTLRALVKPILWLGHGTFTNGQQNTGRGERENVKGDADK